MNNDSQHIKVE